MAKASAQALRPVNLGVVATTVGQSPEDIREKVCVRCHIPGKLTHSVVPK